MIAATKPASTTAAQQAQAQVIAQTPAVVPTVKIEQSRKFNVDLIKDIPMEVDVKSQSVAI